MNRNDMNRLSIVIVMTLVAAGCAVTGPGKRVTRQDAADKKMAMDLYIEGKIAEAKEDHAEAVTSYMEALRYDPKSEEITLALARALFRDKKTRSALHYARLAVKLNPKKPEAWRLLQQLEQLEGRTAEAAKALKKYIELSPDSDFSDILWLARYYFELGETDDARKLLKSVLDDDKAAASEMSAAAVLLAEEGFAEDAETIFLRITERDPMDIQAWLSLGELYEKTGRYEKAKETYAKALEKNPDSLDLMVTLGNLCLVENDWDCAIRYFEMARDTGAPISKIPKVLCALYFYAGREDDAREALRRLKESGEDDASLYFSLGKAMNFLERYEESVAFYEKGFEKGVEDLPEDEIYAAYGRFAQALVRLGRYDDAIELVREGAGSNLKDKNGMKLLEASIYMEMKRYDDAILIYEWLLASDPENVFYVMRLGQAYMSAGKYDKAEETFLKVGRMDPDNIDYLIQLSLVYDLAGRFEEAEKSLLAVLEKDPENALALNNLAYMYIEHDKRLSKAIEMARTALSLDPRNGAYHDTLGWGLYKKGKYEEAKKYIENALKWEDTPDRGVIYDHYGDILVKLGMKKEAAEAYRKAMELGEDTARIQPKLDGIK